MIADLRPVKRLDKISIDFETDLSYWDFRKRKIDLKLNFNNGYTTLSNSKWFDEWYIARYKAYKSIFKVDIDITDKCIKFKLKDFIIYLIMKELAFFWLNDYHSEKIFTLLQKDIIWIFYSKLKNLTKENFRENTDYSFVVLRNLRNNSYEFPLTDLVPEYIKYKTFKKAKKYDKFKRSYNMLKEIWKSDKFFNDEIIWKSINNVRYKEEYKNNSIIEYIYYCIYNLGEELYLTFNWKNCFIFNKESLEKQLKENPYFTISLNSIFKQVFKEQKVKCNNKNIDKIIYNENEKRILEGLLPQLEYTWNIEIIAISKEKDLMQYPILDYNLPFSDIWYSKYKGRKQYIKIETTLKLKN